MTNAVPFGVYIAPISIIRADIRKCVSDGEWCYIQLVKRNSDQTYAVYVASSLTDLRRISLNESDTSSASDRVYMSTITRQDLHLQCGLLFGPCAEQPLYAAPDCVLKHKCSKSLEKLQLFASSDWLCYFRIFHVFADGSVRIRVAALPHRINDTDSGRSYFTTLSREEFALALELDRKDLDLATCDLREKVEERAQRIQPIEHTHPEVCLDEEDQEISTLKPAYPPEVLKMLRPVEQPLCVTSRKRHLVDEEQLPQVQRPNTRALPPVFVPETTVQQAVDRFKAITGVVPTSRKHRQKVWLQAALNTLQACKEHATQPVKTVIELQDQRIRDVLVNWLSSAVLLVEAVPVFAKGKVKKSSLQGYVIRVEQLESEPC